jgi:hypothetical protein
MRLPRIAALLLSTLTAIQCGGSTAAPGATSGVSGVSLTAASIIVGASGQGTVTITPAAPAAGASVTLSSSNPSVASVPATLAIASGTSSAPFAITAIGAGTATFTATMNGSSGQSAVLTVAARAVTLASISLDPSGLVGGDSARGTATLTGAAPAGGAVVTLTGSDAVTMPPSVTVPAGSTTAVFTIQTRSVASATSSTITGSYGGASASAVLAITSPTVANASFGVSGPTESETCTMGNGGSTLNCTFNGSTSTAPGTIVAWDWTYTVAKTFSQTTAGAVLSQPAVNCSLLPSPPLTNGATSFPLTVTLKIHDSLGNVSAVAVDSSARVIPTGACGF